MISTEGVPACCRRGNLGPKRAACPEPLGDPSQQTRFTRCPARCSETALARGPGGHGEERGGGMQRGGGAVWLWQGLQDHTSSIHRDTPGKSLSHSAPEVPRPLCAGLRAAIRIMARTTGQPPPHLASTRRRRQPVPGRGAAEPRCAGGETEGLLEKGHQRGAAGGRGGSPGAQLRGAAQYTGAGGLSPHCGSPARTPRGWVHLEAPGRGTRAFPLSCLPTPRWAASRPPALPASHVHAGPWDWCLP